MASLQGGTEHVALFFCVAASFAAAIGALSMAVTVGIFPAPFHSYTKCDWLPLHAYKSLHFFLFNKIISKTSLALTVNINSRQNQLKFFGIRSLSNL